MTLEALPALPALAAAWSLPHHKRRLLHKKKT